jgi:energy-coupling factor transporter ATP-binding protein EcfA2
MSTIFESFNAKYLEPQQVAKTFVPPDYYSEVLKRAHTLIVGPRGSGKTTILTMLQAQALEVWTHPRANDYRARVDFTGVFIPTDRSWSQQVNLLGGQTVSDQERNRLGIAAFTTHVLRALVEAMVYKVHPPNVGTLIPHLRVHLDRQQESELVNGLADQFHLDLKVPSLMALKQSLTSRLSQISEIAEAERDSEMEGRSERFAQKKFLYLNFLTSAAEAVERFDDQVGLGGTKWALMFDELELAPDTIRKELMRSLRGATPRLLFKLSMSPFSEDFRLLHDELSATFGNDYNQVALWYAHKERGYPFCQDLFDGMLRDRGLPVLRPHELFGTSVFETGRRSPSSEKAAYRPGSRLYQRFVSMATKDRSFRDYLNRKGIDIEALHLMQEEERAATVRKVVSLIAVREAYRSPKRPKEGKPASQRGRKNPNLYAGATSLFAIVEGNPRWFIGIVGALIDEYAKRKSRIPPSRQSLEVQKAVNRYLAYLRTIPCPSLTKDSKPQGVLDVLDVVGEFFHDVVVNHDFTPDPTLSFNVDESISQDLESSLGRALNAGAIVYVNEPDSDLILAKLRNRRFRLTYLLAPHYRAPILLGRAISLSSILASADSERRTKKRRSGKLR